MKRDFSIKPVGDRALNIEFENEISESTNQNVINLKIILSVNEIRGVGTLIPSYRALLIRYDPIKISYADLTKAIYKLYQDQVEKHTKKSKVYLVPVCYEKVYGLDLKNVASYNGLAEEEVIRLHSERDYRIYMLGFTPGFPYLGGMNGKLATPRLAQPRLKIPAGSVGIAGEQTGIYPVDSPGGWQIIGRTPIKLFDIDKVSPALFETSDYIRFVPIDKAQFDEIEAQVKSGIYTCIVEGRVYGED